MKRLTRLLALALVLSVGPTTLVAAQLAPVGVELSAAPIMLAQAAAPLDLPTVGAVADVEAVELPTVPSWNPADWFKDAAALAGVVAALVAFLTANLLKSVKGLGKVALSFALGIGLSLLGTITWPGLGRPNELTGMAAVMFGVNAAVFASGGWDLIKGLIMAALSGKSRSAEAT